jgi:hypothetical protein
MADIDKSICYAGRSAEKKHALKSPVREIDKVLTLIGCMGQDIAKIIVNHQIRFNPAILAGKQPVCFLQYRGSTALGALMFDEKIDYNLQPGLLLPFIGSEFTV